MLRTAFRIVVDLKPESRHHDQTRGDILQYFTRGYTYDNVDERGSGSSFGHGKAALSPDGVRNGRDPKENIISTLSIGLHHHSDIP